MVVRRREGRALCHSSQGVPKTAKKRSVELLEGPPHPDPAVGRQRVSCKCTTGLPGVALEQVSALVSSGAAFGELRRWSVRSAIIHTGTKQRVLLRCRVLRGHGSPGTLTGQTRSVMWWVSVQPALSSVFSVP